MKKLLLTGLSVLTLGLSSTAQFEVSNLYGGADIGYARPVGKFSDFAKGGLTYGALLGYKLDERLSLGIEATNTITAAVGDDQGVLNITFYGLGSYMATGIYTLADEDAVFKPFGGIGLGVATAEEPDITDSEGEIIFDGASSVGLASKLTLGFMVKGFKVAYSFNYAGNSPKNPEFTSESANLPILYHRFVVGYVYNF